MPMTNIFSQLNPMAAVWLLVLVVGAFGGIYVLRLVRKGAKKPADIVQATKDRMDQKKARKVAVKEAEAAIAAPVASSRLSRIGVRGNEEAVADDGAEPEWTEAETTITADANGEIFETHAPDWDAEPATAAFAADEPVDDPAVEPEYAPVMDAEPSFQPAVTEADAYPPSDAETLGDFPEPEVIEAELPPYREPEPIAQASEAVEPVAPAFAVDAAPEHAPETMPPTSGRLARGGILDLADPELHPANWDELLAVVRVLKIAIQRSWSEDVLAPALRTRLYMARAEAGPEVNECPKVRAAAQQLAATDLARTINSAAREQAAEVIAVVEDCAHQMVFTAQDCSAVMTGLSEIQWMALIDHDGELEKRTMPLTRHDPEAPLWVAEALDAMECAEPSRAAAA
jgi:hypothetical protein